MRKIILSVTAAAMLGSIGTVPLAASNEIEYNDPAGYTFRYTENGDEITIEKCITGDSDDLVIPKEIDGKKVTALGAYIFDEGFKSLTIEADIEVIPEYCVFDAKGLETVVLNEGLKILEGSNFYACPDLESITLPESLEKLGDGALYDNRSLASITIPDNVKEIGMSVLMDCPSLTTINWDMTADECDDGFAENTPWLREYSKDHDWLALNDGEYLVQYIGSTGDVVIPEFTKMNPGACADNDAIRSVTIDRELPESTFVRCPNLTKAVVTSPVLSGSTFYDCEALTDVTLSDEITTIEPRTFAGCSSLKTIDLPDELEVIGDRAFSSSGLTEIDIPETVTKIGERAFSYCKGLTSVKLPSNLRELGEQAFYNCTGLKSVNIPSGVANSLKSTFSMCTSLSDIDCETVTESIYLATNNTPWRENYAKNQTGDFFIIGSTLLAYNGSDRDPVIPDGVKVIEDDAFLDADIDSVTIPSSVETINSSAFYGSALKELTIPSTVKEIGMYAFAECDELEKLDIKGGTKIGKFAFSECTSLKDENISISDSAQINKQAFSPMDSAADLPAASEEKPESTKAPAATAKPQTTEKPQTTAKPEPTESPGPKTLTVTNENGEISINIEDDKVVFPDAKPFIDENGRTQIPIRAAAELLGCDVEWNGLTQTVTITDGDEVVTLVIGRTQMQKGQQITEMDTAPVIVNDRTYIPVRFAGEALGLEVNWNE